MLVLKRQVNQVIIIGDDIEVMVTSISHDSVRLGVTAPRELSVHRKEVYDSIKHAPLTNGRTISGTGEGHERPEGT